jgi:MoaA/NifB/PqqE/SkfB family radical SAM enzyme
MAKEAPATTTLKKQELFSPFLPIKGRYLPSKLVRLFASSKTSFKEKYLAKLPPDFSPSKELLKLLNTLDIPIPRAKFPDFLRCLGAISEKPFIGPKRILFDISYGCNLDCVYCRRHSAINPGDSEKAAPERADAFLPLETMIEILDDAKELMVEEVLLVGGGEPTIHPQFKELIRAVKERGFGLNFSTNGLVLGKDLVDTIVENQVDNITVSVSGVSFESYKATHPMMSEGGFKRLFHNFEYLNYRKRKAIQETSAPYIKPFTIFLHVLTRDNVHELSDMVFTGAEYGFDTIWFKLVHPSSWSRHLCLTPEQAKQVKLECAALKSIQSKLNIEVDNYLDEEINNLDQSGDWSGYFHDQRRCFVGWNFSYVDLSRDYSFCCGDKIVGLEKEHDSFYDFWLSKEYSHARSCARNINFGGKNIDTYNGGAIIDDFCKSCDNTNFNNEMENLIQHYKLESFL